MTSANAPQGPTPSHKRQVPNQKACSCCGKACRGLIVEGRDGIKYYRNLMIAICPHCDFISGAHGDGGPPLDYRRVRDQP